MARILIKSFPSPGFDGIFRARRKWPASGVTVETISGEVDIEADADGPLRVGERTMQALKEDGRFSVFPTESIEDIEALKARVAELEAENAALKGEHKGGKGKGEHKGGKGPE